MEKLNYKVVDERTLKLSVIEGALYTIAFNATQGFVYSTLALHFNFSPVIVSVVAVLPATSQIVQFFTPLVYRLIPSKSKAIFWLALVARASFIIVPVALMINYENGIIVAIPFVVFNVLNNIVGNLWTSAMKSLVPEERRNTYFAFRNSVATFAGLVGWLFYSSVLQVMDRKNGLLVSYLFSSVIFVLTAYLLKLHRIPEAKETHFSLLAPLSTLKIAKFRKFIGFVVFWNVAIQFAGPFFSYFEVSYLKVPYSYLGFLNLLSAVVTMLAYSFFGRVSNYFGEKNMIKFGIALTFASVSMYSFMNTSNYKFLIVLATIFASTAWSAINLNYFTLLLKISEEPSEIYFSMHAFVAGVSSLFASYLGGLVLSFIRTMDFGRLSPYNVMFLFALLMRVAVFIYFSKLELGSCQRDMRFVEMGYRMITRRF
ncbi:MFS transporter [Fervidobacterium thailandense]|uniref:MFS transporter n=1 Tax=Fervidobacterium thailandense TaxID=1008305 RepID=A0A1E3G3Z8_9BACT|nr:MFS transporter [Fervidobacterium thailandense]ODN30892.1 MFS transporter [Fervidobacterium thailandense]